MKPTILIADDSPIIRNIVGSVIRSIGYELLTAVDGLDGIKKAFSALPDLIVLDISMPILNGFQACRLLKNDPVTSHIPVIILTSEKKPISQFWGKEVGADRYIVKSTEIEPLSEAIQSLLKGKKSSSAQKKKKMEEITETKILSKISQLLDRELIKSTLKKIELESILQNINEAVIVIDQTDKIREINDYGVELFGLKKRKWSNMRITQLFPEREFLSFKRIIEQSSLGVLKEREITYTSNSKKLSLLIDFSLIKNFQSEIEAIVVLFRDITYLKEIELMKADYFYNVAQEIRNPLTSAKEAIHIILNDLPEKLSKTQKSVLKIVEEDVKRLVRFTDSMVNISEMELSPSVLDIDEIDAGNLLGSALDKNKKMADLKEVKLRFKAPEKKIIVFGDNEKLSEVFSSVISNAIKFNKPKGAVSVSLSTTKKGSSSFLRITIRDTGAGIDPAELKVLFDKEKKVDARLRKKGGEFGLSMAIAKMVIELHQGSIDVKSILGKGTTVMVSLPLNKKD